MEISVLLLIIGGILMFVVYAGAIFYTSKKDYSKKNPDK
jgi:hypothetical protein